MLFQFINADFFGRTHLCATINKLVKSQFLVGSSIEVQAEKSISTDLAQNRTRGSTIGPYYPEHISAPGMPPSPRGGPIKIGVLGKLSTPDLYILRLAYFCCA